MRLRALSLVLVASLFMQACGNATEVEPAQNAETILADLPVFDGSSSTLPLRMFVYCELVRTDCEWETLPDGSRRVLPEDRDDLDLFRDVIRSSGTNGSYVALAEGSADVVLTARAPTDEEVQLAQSQGVQLNVSPVALDAFVFLVNDANPVESLTLDQIRGIFSGAITNWADVGGDDRPIQPYQRNETSGSQVLMRDLVMEGVPMADAPNLMLPSMLAPFDAISRDADGIGYSVHYYATNILLNEDIRLLRIDGTAPKTSTIRSRDYPLVTDVFAVLDQAAPEGDPARLLQEWLFTSSGQATIEDSGYVAIQ